MTIGISHSDKLHRLLMLLAAVILSSLGAAKGQTVTSHYSQQPVLTVPDIGEVPASPDLHEGQLLYDRNAPSGASVPQPCYWIASSRGLPQNPAESTCRRLEYFHRLSDGRIQRTSLPTLASQFVPGVPVCIFIHGAYVDAESHRTEAAYTYNWIRRAAPQLPIQVIFYTWPSDAECKALSPLLVNQRARWAGNNAFYLADLIGQLPPECPVCFVGHSLGARTAVATMHLLAGGQVAGYSYPYNTGAGRRYRAVLAAAAFDRNWLNPGQKYGRALSCVEGVVNLQNRGDWALSLYPFRRPFSRKAIGATGFTRWDRAHIGGQSCKAIDLDVTYYVGLGHTWPHYYEEPSIARAIVPYAYFVDQR